MAAPPPPRLHSRLAEAINALEAAQQRRWHLEAELALLDASSSMRKWLIQKTREHVRWNEKYVEQLKQCQPLKEHAYCHKIAGPDVFMALALDCEMVGTMHDDMALARVSVVDCQGKTVLDCFVLPCEPTFIQDTRTAITGLSKRDLIEKGISLKEARRRFAELCSKDTVLIGHALDHDLLALQFSHENVIDTSLLFPVLGADGNVNNERVHGLSFLSEIVLSRNMDRSERGGVHDSIEDSCNSLDLVKFLVIALQVSGFKFVPPIPPKGRRYKQRGTYGFAAFLRGTQNFVSDSMAKVPLERAQRFYSLDLSGSMDHYKHKKETIIAKQLSVSNTVANAKQLAQFSQESASSSSSSSLASAPRAESSKAPLVPVVVRTSKGKETKLVAQDEAHKFLFANNNATFKTRQKSKKTVNRLMKGIDSQQKKKRKTKLFQ